MIAPWGETSSLTILKITETQDGLYFMFDYAFYCFYIVT